MFFILTVRAEFNYEVEVSARFEAGHVVYLAELSESCMISHFDHKAVHEGTTVEAAIESIARGLDDAIEMLRAT